MAASVHERGPVSKAAVDFVRSAPARVTGITLAVAPDVDEQTAREAWAHAVEGTPVERASVTVEVRFPEMLCLSCGVRYHGEKLDRCPECRGDGLPTQQVPVAAVVGWSTDGEG